MLQAIYDALFGGFLDVVTALEAIVNSLFNFVAWMPVLSSMMSTGFILFVPAAFASVAVVSVVIFLIKALLGGSND